MKASRIQIVLVICLTGVLLITVAALTRAIAAQQIYLPIIQKPEPPPIPTNTPQPTAEPTPEPTAT